MADKKWLVFYTKSRHEERVREYLDRRGFEVFLPMQEVIRQWSDRKKKVTVPLFRSYIFVNEDESQVERILQTPGIAWNVRHNEKPAILQERERDLIQRFLSTGLYIETESIPEINNGELVRVIDGALKGVEGRVVQSSTGEKFSVTLSVLGNSMLIKLDARLLERVSTHINE